MITYIICGVVLIAVIAFVADKVIKNKMLTEECAALRRQLYESDRDTAGYGINAYKGKKFK